MTVKKKFNLFWKVKKNNFMAKKQSPIFTDEKENTLKLDYPNKMFFYCLSGQMEMTTCILSKYKISIKKIIKKEADCRTIDKMGGTMLQC